MMAVPELFTVAGALTREQRSAIEDGYPGGSAGQILHQMHRIGGHAGDVAAFLAGRPDLAADPAAPYAVLALIHVGQLDEASVTELLDRARLTSLRVSVADIRAGRLPGGAAGVLWTDIGFTECRPHLTDPAWRPDNLQDPDARTGVVLAGYIRCDACADTAITYEQVRALRGAAATAGDTGQVRMCDRALLGSTTAWEQCREVIVSARLRAAEDPPPDWTGTEFTVPQGMDHEGDRAVVTGPHAQPGTWEARITEPDRSDSDCDGALIAITGASLEFALAEGGGA
jgi:hypothetical protein